MDSFPTPRIPARWATYLLHIPPLLFPPSIREVKEGCGVAGGPWGGLCGGTKSQILSKSLSEVLGWDHYCHLCNSQVLIPVIWHRTSRIPSSSIQNTSAHRKQGPVWESPPSEFHLPPSSIKYEGKQGGKNPAENPHFPPGFPQTRQWKACCNLLKINRSKNLQILSVEDRTLQSTGMKMFNLTREERSTLQNHQNSPSLCFCDRKPPSLTLEVFIQKSKFLVVYGLGPWKIIAGTEPAGMEIEDRDTMWVDAYMTSRVNFK